MNITLLQQASQLAERLNQKVLVVNLLQQQIALSIKTHDYDSIETINEHINYLHNQIPDWVAVASNIFQRSPTAKQSSLVDINRLRKITFSIFESGDVDEAIILQTQLANEARTELGRQHQVTFSAFRDLGSLMQSNKDFNAAVFYFKYAISLGEPVLGKNHPDILDVHTLLVESYLQAELEQDAVRIQTENAAAFQAALGEFHPLTIEARFRTIHLFDQLNRYSESRVAHQILCDDLARGYGSYHPETLRCLTGIARTASNEGDLQSAVDTYQVIHKRYQDLNQWSGEKYQRPAIGGPAPKTK